MLKRDRIKQWLAASSIALAMATSLLALDSEPAHASTTVYTGYVCAYQHVPKGGSTNEGSLSIYLTPSPTCVGTQRTFTMCSVGMIACPVAYRYTSAELLSLAERVHQSMDTQLRIAVFHDTSTPGYGTNVQFFSN